MRWGMGSANNEYERRAVFTSHEKKGVPNHGKKPGIRMLGRPHKTVMVFLSARGEIRRSHPARSGASPATFYRCEAVRLCSLQALRAILGNREIECHRKIFRLTCERESDRRAIAAACARAAHHTPNDDARGARRTIYHRAWRTFCSLSSRCWSLRPSRRRGRWERSHWRCCMDSAK